jgi:ABC-2 type transport system ATP-binding protein
MLEIEALVKRFGNSAVVDGISFSVDAGEVVGFVGPNGAGKSTTMKVICGLLKPNSGKVTIDGIASSEDARVYLSKLGALIESPAFYPSLTGRDHLAYLARMRGQRIDALISSTLARVGLDTDSNKPVRKYSTGMKQRLGIAMAILHQPKLLILDEPTNGLDPAAIVAMRDLIRQLSEGGTAVLVSSHLLFEIERVCDRVVFIKAGRVIRDQKIQQDVPSVVRMLVRCNDPETAQETLARQDFVLEIHPSEKGLVCTLSAQKVGQLGSVLVHSGLELLELSPVRDGLEDAYISDYGTGMREGLK